MFGGEGFLRMPVVQWCLTVKMVKRWHPLSKGGGGVLYHWTHFGEGLETLETEILDLVGKILRDPLPSLFSSWAKVLGGLGRAEVHCSWSWTWEFQDQIWCLWRDVFLSTDFCLLSGSWYDRWWGGSTSWLDYHPESHLQTPCCVDFGGTQTVHWLHPLRMTVKTLEMVSVPPPPLICPQSLQAHENSDYFFCTWIVIACSPEIHHVKPL